MTYSVLWTVLPAGFADGRAQLSLVAAPRGQGITTIGGTPLANWPAVVNALGPLFLADTGGGEPQPLTRRGGPASSPLWTALFGPATRVLTKAGGRRALGAARPGPAFAATATALEQMYGSVNDTNPTGSLGADHVVRRAIAALATVDSDPRVARAMGREAGAALLAPAATSSAALATAVRRLREEGHEDLAMALPIAAYARWLRRAGGPRRAPGPDGRAAGGPLTGVNSVAQADFHQVCTLLMAHPALSVPLGLRVDLEMAPFDGARTVRVVDAAGQPLNGPVPRSQPFSAMVSDLSARRFTMATEPDARAEIVGGVLNLRNPATTYVLTSVDVASLSGQLAAASTASARSGEPLPVRLPVRRDVGLTLGQQARAEAVVSHATSRTDAIASAGAQAPAVLFADDVTTGYRLDVATDGGPFRSLMRRRVRYTVGESTVDADDEGRTEAVVAAQQDDEFGVTRLVVGEEIAGWDGWGLSVGKPGPKVGGDGRNSPEVEEIDSVLAPGYPLRAEITTAPGTLPRLRYGRSYQLRARAVDIAGTAIDPDVCDPTQVLPAVRYLRHEAAGSPTLVPTRRFTEGESLLRLVVRSDGQGTLLGTCERHVAAPDSPQMLAERHGMFDAAFGPQATPAVRERMFAVARREEGSFLDPMVPGPNGAMVPQPGLQLVTSDPTRPVKGTLPVPRGRALPNGAYVVIDAPAALLPYLPDPAVAGVAIGGVPGASPVVSMEYGGSWPDLPPAKLVVRPMSAGSSMVQVSVKQSDGRSVLIIEVPPGVEQTFELSSTLHPDRLDHLATGAADPQDVLDGQVLGLSSRQPVTVVHAVQKPLVAPALTGPPTVTAAGLTGQVTVTAQVQAHRPTTGRVHLAASWLEAVDAGTGSVDPQPRTATLAPVDLERTGGPATLTASQFFGDTRHRAVTYRPVGSTRFREYFPPVPDGDQSQLREGTEMLVHVPNRAVPPPPDVHSVVPSFRFSRGMEFGEWTSTRETMGVRVWLNRRWNRTGEGELLGVVLFANPADGDAEEGRALSGLVTRWGSDPIEEIGLGDQEHLVAGDFDTPGQVTSTVTLLDPAAGGRQVTVIGHPVHFDAERDLWFADIDVDVDLAVWPFLRLGLVRFQPHSLPGRAVSRVVTTDLVQLPPHRQIKVKKFGTTGVRVNVFGKPATASEFTMRHERRMPDPFLASSDIGSDIGVRAQEGATGTPGDGWRVTALPAPAGGIAAMRLEWLAAEAPPDQLMRELRAGRVVVQERQRGWAVTGPGEALRTVYTEVFDRAVIDPNPPATTAATEES
ncbi:hypothetical protein [Micromonospora sp. NPDC048898]|uniref:hypothetical protein n=1 Tax=Micromonospora sp. NPDC048898 TaxID=3364260 RepID=UPI00372040B9